jgi:DNA-binding PadR family transcriptional regulator
MDASQLLKGVLDLAVLAAVREEDGYGYDVVRRLRGAGLDDVGDASVYGTLRRLYSAGALTSYVVPSDEGPHRKYYAINERGPLGARGRREDLARVRRHRRRAARRARGGGMSTPLAPTTDARLYLDAVAAALADLPVEDRADLLEDLAGHLAAVEREDGDVPLALRLGPPEQYAAELRVAAGLPEARDTPRRLSGGRLRAQLSEDWRDLSQSRAGREVAAFLPQLVPAWWVLRAYLLVFLLALMSGSRLRDAVLLDVGLPLVGWALLAAAVVGSVRLGRRSLAPHRRQVLLVAEVALAGLAASVVLGAPAVGVQTVYVESSSPLGADGQWPLLSPAGPVTDIHPYAADGTPLEGVLLFDQDGRPLRVGAQQWWADGCQRVPRPPLAVDGVPVSFSYPQRYVLSDDFRYEPPGVCDPEVPRPPVPLPQMAATPEPTAPATAPPTAPPAAPAPVGVAPADPAPADPAPVPEPAAPPPAAEPPPAG